MMESEKLVETAGETKEEPRFIIEETPNCNSVTNKVIVSDTPENRSQSKIVNKSS